MDHDDGRAGARQGAPLTAEQFEGILRFDTCTIANAIECFGVRMLNEGFTRPGLNYATDPELKILGFAATFRVRSTDPPTTGGRFGDRMDWWDDINSLPLPRIAVFQNLDEGFGACIGDVHAAVLKSFGCQGAVTDGAIRDVAEIRKIGFAVFAASVAVSHSYMRIVDFGAPVEIFGLAVKPGDLLYADRHGVVSIPTDIAGKLPEVAERIRRKDQRIIEVCQMPDFSPGKLAQVIAADDPCK